MADKLEQISFKELCALVEEFKEYDERIYENLSTNGDDVALKKLQAEKCSVAVEFIMKIAPLILWVRQAHNYFDGIVSYKATDLSIPKKLVEQLEV